MTSPVAKRSSLVAALALTGCAASTQAPPTFWASAADYPRGFLDATNKVDAAAFVPPPPVIDGPTDRADREILRQTRALEGSPRWDMAKIDAVLGTPDAPRAFECALGVTFDPAKAPTLTRLLARILPDVETVQAGVKRGATFRQRPYVRDGYRTCVPGEALAKSSSYPSGHSAIGWTWALILSEIAPDRADALLKRGVAYGKSRVVCGFHYPSDVEQGRVVGAALLARIQSVPQFQAELTQAKREVVALRATSTLAPRCATEDAILAAPGW